MQDYLNSFNSIADQKVGVYGYGSIKIDNNDTAAVTEDVAASSSNLHLDAVVKIVSDGQDAAIQGFVTRLVA